MPTTIHLQCTCGKVRASVSDVAPQNTSRCVCYCRSCRAYAQTLGRGDWLDVDGGTDLFQVSPRTISFERGFDLIQAGCMTSKGAYRWHTNCCKTPVANTFPHNRFPFVAIPVRAVEPADASGSVDLCIGPIRARVNGDFGSHAPDQSGRLDVASMILRYGLQFGRWWLRGDQKHSPFFQPDGSPAGPVIRLDWIDRNDPAA